MRSITRFTGLFIFLSLIWVSRCFSQGAGTTGTEFWLGFMPNANLLTSERAKTEIYISSKTATTGVVEMEGIAFSQAFTVPANGVTSVKIPVAGEISVSEAPVAAGIHVT